MPYPDFSPISARVQLKGRHITKQLSDQISTSNKPVFLEEFPSTLTEEMLPSKDIWLVGVSLSRTIRTHYSDIERKLEQGHKINILLVQPEGIGAKIASERPYPKADPEQVRREIRASLAYLCKLKATNPSKLEIRTIDNPLTHGIIAIDPNSALGSLYIEFYPYQTKGMALPRFILKERDGYWFEYFKGELHNLWNNGEEWKCPT